MRTRTTHRRQTVPAFHPATGGVAADTVVMLPRQLGAWAAQLQARLGPRYAVAVAPLEEDAILMVPVHAPALQPHARL